MPNLNDVYRKFGEVAEAAQLVETELGNLAFWRQATQAGLLAESNSALAKQLLDKVNKQTSGQLVKQLERRGHSYAEIEADLAKALIERNRLFHSYYREHNLRRNSSSGCQVMLDDLKRMHDTILKAYKGVLLLSGVDLEILEHFSLPKEHLKL